LFQQGLSLAAGLGPEEDFQEIVEVFSDAFSEHEAMSSGECTGVIEGPQN
jgi:hypothetical protein